MKNKSLVLFPVMLALSAFSAVDPAYHYVGSRSAPCVQGGPDSVAQQFYDIRLQQGNHGKPDAATLASYRPYLSTALYQSLAEDGHSTQNLARLPAMDIFNGDCLGPTSVTVRRASRIPNTDAKNIPLQISPCGLICRGDRPDVAWQAEALMIREGTCWVLDDVRYLGATPPAPAGTLRQTLETR